MKAVVRFLAPDLLGFALALLVSGGWIADAQQTMEVPPPAPQGGPTFQYRPKPTPRPFAPTPNATRQYEQSDLTPSTPPPVVSTPQAPPPAYQIQQPVLPAIFRGCWEGKVEFLDSIEREPGAAKVGTWTPKTYRLCYQRYGDNPFQLTFSEAGIDSNRKITNPQSSMSLLSSDGRTYATMRAQLHFDEYHNGNNFSGATFAVDETTRLQCAIQPDGMHVIGSVRGMRDGEPWFRAYWHAIFVHVPA